MNSIIQVIGSGGHAVVVYDAILAGQGEPVIKTIEALDGELPMIVAIGNNRDRRRTVANILAKFPQAFFTSVVHPRAIICGGVTIGPGSFIAAGAVIAARAHIGEHVIVNTAATIDHESFVAAYANISPGAHICGRCQIGEGANVYAGGIVAKNIAIGEWATVAAASLVLEDVPPNCTVYGTPAKPKEVMP